MLGADGYVAQEQSDSYSRGDRTVITFKVPRQRYPDVLARLGRDLGKRESLHQSTEDVTEEVADVDSRVKSARAALDQFRKLLSEADTDRRDLADRARDRQPGGRAGVSSRPGSGRWPHAPAWRRSRSPCSPR